MVMIGKWAAALGAVVALGGALSPHVANAKAPGQIILTPQSEEALVIIKTDWWQPAPSMHSAFKLLLSTYVDAEARLSSGPFSGTALFEAKQKNFLDGYLMVPVKPGRWVVRSYSQQDSWALCFNAASLQFEAKPGQVVYLGRFDALSHRQQLTRQAIASGNTSIRGCGFVDYFDLPQGPIFAPVDAPQIAAVQTMLARRVPGVSVPVQAVAFTPATFGTGSTLYGTRRCGGYFPASGKGKADKS
ncbi:hypothetical protein ACKU27_18770 [Sphingobium yanoikuyae]|uniref:hypothetical protein n=1 Tax=Sphingobium yanoikuyae TaxID=13690 RepID=UPI003B917171